MFIADNYGKLPQATDVLVITFLLLVSVLLYRVSIKTAVNVSQQTRCTILYLFYPIYSICINRPLMLTIIYRIFIVPAIRIFNKTKSVNNMNSTTIQGAILFLIILDVFLQRILKHAYKEVWRLKEENQWCTMIVHYI